MLREPYLIKVMTVLFTDSKLRITSFNPIAMISKWKLTSKYHISNCIEFFSGQLNWLHFYQSIATHFHYELTVFQIIFCFIQQFWSFFDAMFIRCFFDAMFIRCFFWIIQFLYSYQMLNNFWLGQNKINRRDRFKIRTNTP